MNGISRMTAALVISILELILLRSRSNARKVEAFHPAEDYVFGFVN
jgi:hypothetical protein